ncbi:MAG: enhanced serine sensitivity protein SseB [Clostridiales bacterium]|nr:enhanced serine sensitivity protein SseB [Clostridiales bacterium]
MNDFKGVKMEGSKVPAEQIKNPELIEAIENMQQDNCKENIDAMVNAVMKAKFILPAKVTPVTQARTKNDQTMMGQSTQVQFRLLENQNKDKFFGIFTDTDELFKWNDTQSSHKVVTDFDSIAQMVMDPKAGVQGFVINPFGKSVTFPKQMVISLKQQRDYIKMNTRKIQPGSQVQLGEPEEYPIDLMAALINHFSTEETVNAAYLRLLEQNGEKSYLIVVDFYGNMEQTFSGISDVAKPYLDDDIELLMMPYSMEFARTAVNKVQPFYKKSQDE